MRSNRRIGSPDSQTREKLLDSAAYLLWAEGYSAVTVRRLASHAGLSWQIVHYYFRSMEELFVAVVRRSAEQHIERQKKMLASDNPLRSVWDLVSNRVGAKLEIEYLALANHFESVRELLAEFRTQSRMLQMEAVKDLLEGKDVLISFKDPGAILLVLRTIARGIAMETNVGITDSHAECINSVEQALQQFDRSGAID